MELKNLNDLTPELMHKEIIVFYDKFRIKYCLITLGYTLEFEGFPFLFSTIDEVKEAIENNINNSINFNPKFEIKS